jgi:hypothetical protein
MSCRSRCDEPVALDCQCAFDDTDCVVHSGSGNDGDPVILEPRLNADSLNLLECRADGLYLAMADRFATWTIRKTLTVDDVLSDGDVVQFPTLEYDTGVALGTAMNLSNARVKIPFKAKWRIMCYTRYVLLDPFVDGHPVRVGPVISVKRADVWQELSGDIEDRCVLDPYEPTMNLNVVDELELDADDRVRIVNKSWDTFNNGGTTATLTRASLVVSLAAA